MDSYYLTVIRLLLLISLSKIAQWDTKENSFFNKRDLIAAILYSVSKAFFGFHPIKPKMNGYILFLQLYIILPLSWGIFHIFFIPDQIRTDLVYTKIPICAVPSWKVVLQSFRHTYRYVTVNLLPDLKKQLYSLFVYARVKVYRRL